MANRSGLLGRSAFPLYIVKALDERHFLVAGGGGAARTGISNAFEIYEVRLSEEKVSASSIAHHDTGTQAIMNGCTSYDGKHHTLIAGLDDECSLFSIKYRVISPKKKAAEDTVRKRTNSENNCNESKGNSDTKQITFEVEKSKCVKTDFNSSLCFQKCVQFSHIHSIVATGGADGHLRVWKYPNMDKLYEVHAHQHEIDDLDISPAGDKIVTISQDRNAYVWNAVDGQKHAEIQWPLPLNDHKFRCCRYGLVEGKKDKFHLYTVNIPRKRSAKQPLPCFVTMWDSGKFTPRLMVKAGTDVLSCLAVSPEGNYLAVGTMSGSVFVFISFSLQKLYFLKDAHSIFVTGLAFMPSSEATREVTGNQDFTLLSVSADNTIRIHQEPPRGTVNIFVVLIGSLMIIFLFFYLITELGL